MGKKEGKNASSEYVFEILRNACEMNSVFEMKLDKFGFLLFFFFFKKKKTYQHILTIRGMNESPLKSDFFFSFIFSQFLFKCAVAVLVFFFFLFS